LEACLAIIGMASKKSSRKVGGGILCVLICVSIGDIHYTNQAGAVQPFSIIISLP
jgi:hypothetical protein